MPGRQRAGRGGARALAIASAEANGTIVTGKNRESSTRSSPVMSKIDKTGLYDLQQVKRVLDDQVIDFLERRGYTEATLVSNVKIFAGMVAVAAAFYSHFNGREFPENRDLVIACVAIYAVCVTLISSISYAYEGDAFYSAYLSDAAELMTGRHDDMLAPKVWVQSTLSEKGNSMYTLTIRQCVRKNNDLSAVLKKPYEQYYDEDGNLEVEELTKDLKLLIAKVGQLGPEQKRK